MLHTVRFRVQEPNPVPQAEEAAEYDALASRFGWFMSTPFQVNQLLQGRAADLLVGSYVLLERLGEGGTGQVFKARHQHMNRIVALKLIRKELVADAEVVGRFQREVHSVSQLSHPNVVRAHDAGPYANGYFLAMEYVEGTDLAQFVKQRGRLPAEEACAYVRQAALGLQHIHERGLVHRDIKPSNLLLTQANGFQLVKILDLGLARLQRPLDEATAALTTDNPVTMGTLDYMAPEQALDFHQADIRADIYSLGCTLYFLLTAQPPFPGGTAAQKLLRHQQAESPRIEQVRRDLPPGLAEVLGRMMAKQPEDRQQTPMEVVQQLAALVRGASSPAVVVSAAMPSTFLPSRILRPAPVPVIIDGRTRFPLRGRLGMAVGNGVRRLRQLHWSRRRRRILGAAAVGVMVLLLAAWFVPWPSKDSGTTSVPSARGEKVYLADLKEVRASTGTEEFPFAKGEVQLGRQKKKIVLNNVLAPKGLFTYPATNGTAEVVYALGGRYQTFHALVGVDDSTTSPSDLYFSVMGDGRVLWRSKPVRKKGDQQTCEADIRGVQTLELVVQCSGPNNISGGPVRALAVWADPYVSK